MSFKGSILGQSSGEGSSLAKLEIEEGGGNTGAGA